MAIESDSLHYFINAPVGISLDPIESDNMPNAIVMKHLVGTLIRYSNGGQYLPYLADKFSTEDNGLVWKFALRKDLKCQNGEPITALGYINGLQKVLKMYSKQGPMPVIEDLIGWKEFLEGEQIAGLSALNENEIEFRFNKKAGPGFLEYLCMPYYGYFCASNFKGANWLSKNHIISSSSYTITDSSSKTVKLLKRENWSLNPITTPSTVLFHTQINEASWKQKHAIIQTSLGWAAKIPMSHKEVKGPPDVIRSIILDPTGPSNFFSDINSRLFLQGKIYELQKKKSFGSKTATLTQSFYAGYSPAFNKSSISNKPKQKLKIYFPKTASDDTNFIISVLKETLDELKWEYEAFIAGETKGINSSDSQSKTKFDIRVSGVVAGNVVEPWVVEMMFGSSQGVSYPDPSGKVISYIKSLNTESNFSFKEAGKYISQIIAEDAAVLPIFHTHSTWYFTEDLDLSGVSGDLIIPSFEDIRIKE